MKQQGSGPVPIAFVLSSCHAGGTERQMIELFRRLNPARWQVHVACIHASGEWLRQASDAAVSIREFPFPGFRHRQVLTQTLEFVRWCREHDIAVVHTVDLTANIFALPAAAAARVPVRIANRREMMGDRTRGQIVAQRAAYQFAHKVVANCRAAADRLRLERVPAARIAVVPNGVDSLAFAATRPSRPVRRVSVVANLEPRKGHDVLIDAAPEVLRRFPDAAFVVVGDRRIARGSHVRLRPNRRADAMDMFLADQPATVAGVYRDVDERVYVAVTVDADPGAALHESFGRFFYFDPAEIEPIDVREEHT